MFYVYVLYSRSLNRFYIGYTGDLERRLKEHLNFGNGMAKKYNDIELAYFEACKSEKDARIRERQLKTGFGRGYLRRRLENYIRAILPAKS